MNIIHVVYIKGRLNWVGHSSKIDLSQEAGRESVMSSGSIWGYLEFFRRPSASNILFILSCWSRRGSPCYPCSCSWACRTSQPLRLLLKLLRWVPVTTRRQPVATRHLPCLRTRDKGMTGRNEWLSHPVTQSPGRPVASVARILIGRLVMSSEFSTTCKIGERFQSPSRPVAQSPRSTTVKERNLDRQL